MSFLRVISRSKRPFEVHLSRIGLRHVKKVEINATQCLNFTVKKRTATLTFPKGKT